MNYFEFNCTKCGACCRELLTDEYGITSGLSLIESEICLFDLKLVKPNMGLGDVKTINVITYQLNQMVCPHIDERNNCKIYDKRPLVCQSYPVEVTLTGGIVRPECPQSFSIPKDGSALTDAGLTFNQILMKKFKQFGDKRSILWFFDLSSNKWTIVPDTFSSQYISQYKRRQKSARAKSPMGKFKTIS
jgi:Fe-S-cluster containining protein